MAKNRNETTPREEPPQLATVPRKAEAVEQEPVAALTDVLMGQVGTWFYFYGPGAGAVYVLALNVEAARKMLKSRYPGSSFDGGLAKRKPANGSPYLKQVPVVEYDEKADPKDIAEMKRRDGINYEYLSR